MKTRYFFSIFMVLFFFFSCNEENEMIISDATLINPTLKFEEAKLAINAMGLDTTFISEWDNYYVVEGDILICKDSLNCSKATTRQYRTTYYADNFQAITIGADNTIAQNTNWREAINEVIYLYNKYTGLRFTYSENNPDIKVFKGYIAGSNVCGSGVFPSSSNKPGNAIIINSYFYTNIDTYLTLNQKIFLLMHELGHNLGLRHTDGIGEGDAGLGLIQIPGTPISDSKSFMNSSTCGKSWSGTSEYDIVALKYLWPKLKVTYVGVSEEEVSYGSYLSRYYVPTSISGIFAGWYEDLALTIPWRYSNQIVSNTVLYPKWRTRTQAVRIQDTSDTSYRENFTLSQTTPVTLTIEVGRGLNEWWEISKFTNKTGAVLANEYASYVMTSYIEPYIWNANPENYMTHTEKTVVLDPGNYWVNAVFTSELGLQYGASGKHGITRATVEY